MLKNVLSFHRIRVEDVMVPRADIVAVAGRHRSRRTLEPVPHGRPFPPAGLWRDPRRPEGMVHIRDFLDFIAMRAEGGPAASEIGRRGSAAELRQIDLSMALSSANILRPVLFVPRLHAGHRPSGADAGDAAPTWPW